MTLRFTDFQQLENSSLFRSLDIDTLGKHFESCLVREVDSATRLLEPGAENRDIFVLLSGELRVYLNGMNMPVHAVLGPGDCVGEMSLIDGQPVSALVVAETACRLLAIPHQVVWALVDHSHVIARNLLGILSGRMRSNNLTLVAAQTRSLEFEQSSSVDILTGLHNRRWLEAAVPRVLERCERDRQPVCMLYLDIDRLTEFNDRHGHAAGDAALRRVGSRLADGLRAQDMIARHGGEEFVIVLPRTEVDQGLFIAERLRDTVAGVPLETANGPSSLTLSCGVAAHRPGESLETLIARADTATRQAKANGRDCVETAV